MLIVMQRHNVAIGTYFGARVTAINTRDMTQFQFLAPEWPNVSNPEVAVEKYGLNNEGDKQLTVLHHFLSSKFLALNDREFSQKIFSLPFSELVKESNIDSYVAYRVERERREKAMTRKVGIPSMKSLVLSTLALNWNNLHQSNAMYEALTLVFNDKLAKALVATANEKENQLHLFADVNTQKLLGGSSLFTLDPTTEKGK